MALAKLSIDIEARLAKFEKDLAGVSRAAEGMASGLKSAFAGLAGAITVGAVVAGIKGIVDELDKLDEASERIGVTVENLSALNYAGRMSGVEFEDLTAALSKLSAKMQDAFSGNKEASAWFKDVGVSVKDASGNLKSADQVFAEIADRFAKFENGAAKTALAVDGFGKSGAQLVPLLNQGSAGLKAMREEAEKLGGIIDEKLAKQAAEFNDNLDRLSVLASSAGKSIAGGLLPWMNEVAQSFVVAQKYSDGFFDSLRLKMPGLQMVDAAGELQKIQQELEQVDFRLSNGRSKDEEADRKLFASLERKAAYYRELAGLKERAEGTGEQAKGGGKPIVRTPTGPKDKSKAEEISAEAQAYKNAMEALSRVNLEASASSMELNKSQKALFDLMSSPEWDNMPETWRQTAVAQFEMANATEKAAEEAKRLNELLKDTEAAKLDSVRKDMELLAGALEKGRISEEQYLEAVKARFDETGEKLKENKTFAEEFGLTFSSAMEDAIVSGEKFSEVLKGLAQDILRIVVRKTVTEPLGDSIAGFLKGIIPNADGGVYSSPSLSAYSGGVYNSPRLFAFANGAGVFGEAGPEAIMPLSRGRDGKLGVKAQGGGANIEININNTAAGTQATATTRSDASGKTIIDVLIEKTKGAVAADIVSGGMVAGAMESQYGLNRSAGAWR